MRISWGYKYPNEITSRAADWSLLLASLSGSPTIASHSFAVLSGGVTIADQGLSGDLSWVRISGGTEGEVGEILCRVVLSNGDEYETIAEFRVNRYPS